jgi:ribosome maturation factor RimP
LKSKLIESIEKKIETKIKDLGFEIEYIEMVKEVGNNILRIVLDKKDRPVNIDDCELVSRTVEDDIDTLVKSEYVLEVSSPGLERQLKNINLYHKYIGKRIYIKLFKKIEVGKEFECDLISADVENETINVLLDNKENITISLLDIASAHTVYDFSNIENQKDDVNLNKLNKFNKN